MRITVSHFETGRNGRCYEVEDGSFEVKALVEKAMIECVRDYKMTRAQMVEMVLSYYFGDGDNHLGCCDCPGYFSWDDAGFSCDLKRPQEAAVS